MSEAIYQQQVLDLARAATGAGKLPDPDVAVTVNNPLCGDRISLELKLRDGRIGALAHRVRGCSLCEASASVIGTHAIGAPAEELRAAAAAAAAILAGAGDEPAWPELAAFRPVAAHKSRHRCVMLPFEALTKALAEAGIKQKSSRPE